MDLNEYDKLRQKIKNKDFEGKNKPLDKWLYRTSYLGNIGSIFFAFFLLYPALYRSFLVNVGGDTLSTLLAGGFTIIFLVIFEVVKRYLIRNFFHDLIWLHDFSIKPKTAGWMTLVVCIVATSFYFSISGSKNFATTFLYDFEETQIEMVDEKDSLRTVYKQRKQPYIRENEDLREVNRTLRERLAETPLNYLTARREYQQSINDNVAVIERNQERINEIEDEFIREKNRLETRYEQVRQEDITHDFYTMVLFIIIVIINESLIILGIYFREYYENKLYNINKNKFERIYRLRDKYKTLIRFLYNEGKLGIGDKLMGAQTLKEIIEDKTNIRHPQKFVKDFFVNTEKLGIFVVEGKRRYINISYNDALLLIDEFDDAFRVFDDLNN